MECIRCHLACASKFSLIRHLQKLTPCAELYSDSTRESIVSDLVLRIAEGKLCPCPHCDKRFENAKCVTQHLNICKSKRLIDSENTIAELKARNDELTRLLSQQAVGEPVVVRDNAFIGDNNTNNQLSKKASGPVPAGAGGAGRTHPRARLQS